jgi:hypothetical protein
MLHALQIAKGNPNPRDAPKVVIWENEIIADHASTIL